MERGPRNHHLFNKVRDFEPPYFNMNMAGSYSAYNNLQGCYFARHVFTAADLIPKLMATWVISWAGLLRKRGQTQETRCSFHGARIFVQLGWIKSVQRGATYSKKDSVGRHSVQEIPFARPLRVL